MVSRNSNENRAGSTGFVLLFEFSHVSHTTHTCPVFSFCLKKVVFSRRSSQTSLDYLVTEVVVVLLPSWNMCDKTTMIDAWGRLVKRLVFRVKS